MARCDQAGFGLGSSRSARQRSYRRGQADEVEAFPFEGIGSMGEPISNNALGAALERNLDEAWIVAMDAAQEVDGVCHVTAGMPPDTIKKSREMRMACGSLASDPGKLSRGYADRHWID
jgi:hypothetical protein